MLSVMTFSTGRDCCAVQGHGGRHSGRGIGGRLGRGGRGRGGGGRGADMSAAGRAVAAGAFNPYAAPDVGAIKGGKRSGTAPRSGNRNMTFGPAS